MMLDVNKLFSLFIISFPFVSLYSFMGSSSVSVAHVLYALVCVALITKTFKTGKIYLSKQLTWLALFCIAIIVNTMYIIFLPQATEAVPRNMIHIIYILSVILFAHFLDWPFLFKMFRFICLFSSLFIILQVLVVFLFNIYIPGVIPGVDLTRLDLNNFFNQASIDGTVARARSIFGEGAEYAQYNILYLAFIILNKQKKYFKDKVIISVGILLSASNLGILGLVILWGWYLFKERQIRLIIEIIAAIIIGIFLAYTMGSFDIIANRLFSVSSGVVTWGNSYEGRVSGYQEYFQMDLSFWQILLGNGIIALRNSGFQPSTLCTFISFGLIGIIPFFGMFFQKYISSQHKIVWFLLFVFSLWGNLFYWNFCLFSFFLMYADFDDRIIG